MELWKQLLFLCPMLFLAGLVDGVSGGGGLIALPSYLMAGLPISTAYACNKMQSCLGTSASLAKYAKSGSLDIKTALPAAAASVAGSWIATHVMLALDDGVKEVIIGVCMCFVVILTLCSGRMRIDAYTTRKIALSWRSVAICLGIGFVLGLYDGFFGPGGGTIALLLFALLMKYDLRVGCGNGKLIIVIANLTSVISYILRGQVNYRIALPCSAANMLGSYVGASVAMKKGARFVKYISWAVIAFLLVQTVLDML